MDMNDEKIFIVTKKQYQFLNTLEEHLKFLSTRQKKQAKTSSISLRCYGNSYLKAMICMNLIKNNVVTKYDANLAMKYYGQDVGGIKVKTVRIRPTPVVSNIMEILD